MSSPVAELEAGLQAMLGLKPPGVSGSRITALTSLCVANVQSESVLIQKLYTHFKKAPGTHKLGVLYVVDSVTRKWLDQAKQHGQAVNGSAPDGTYAAGVNRVTELIPVLMSDILSSAPADQKDKIKKLVDIWEKGQTFPPKLIESFKDRFNAAQPNTSTTPPGSPPVAVQPGAAPSGPPALPPNIMETLANLAKKSSAPATNTPPTLSGPFGQPNSGMPQHMMHQAPYSAQPPPAAAPVNTQQPPYQMPQAQQSPFSLPFGQPGAAAPTPLPSNNQLPPALAGLAGLIGAASQQQPQAPFQQQQPPQQAPNIQQNLMLIQALLSQGMSLDQISGILGQVAGAAGPGSLVPSAIAAAAANAGSSAAQAPQWPLSGVAQPSGDWGNNNSGGRDHGYGGRSPHGRGRSRSRSPRYWDGHGGGRRGSPDGRDQHGRGRDYRQRSPAGGNGSNGRHGGGSDSSSHGPPAPGDKWVEHDPTLPNGSIRVLSRTLFVGGVTIPESELRAIFARFGDVQTCIVNKEKRHAFVKMYTRKDAEAAKIGMEHNRSDDSGLRTRWGVGFGPRDCSDYAKGTSIIPITKLTDADRKWLLTAAWGGSGGQPISSGLVVEEPDIEIGAGVSSKAISRRMQTDRGGANGPRSTRREEELANANTIPINPHGPNIGGRRGGRGGGRNGGGHDHRGGGSGSGTDSDMNMNYNNAGTGAGDRGGIINNNSGNNGFGAFPFNLQVGANGMPVFPPGFTFPAPE